MDAENVTGYDIKRKIGKLVRIQIGYNIFYAANAFIAIAIEQPQVYWMKTPEIAWINIALRAFYFIIRMWAHVYLIRMVLSMQRLFRTHMHIKGYYGEIWMAITYSIYFVGEVLWFHFYRPYLVFQVQANGVECAEDMKRTYVVWRFI